MAVASILTEYDEDDRPHKGSSPDDPGRREAAADQRPSIWSTYIEHADKHDQIRFGRWNSSMATLLVFAALFTAIVTSFVIDAMSDLKDNPTTRILYVNALWLLSIVASLGVSTCAMLCQEWCTLHLQGRKPEDKVGMAIKRQRMFESVRKWRMEGLVTSIPVFLHLSIFLFLGGLWIRLSDVNRALGFVVGIPSLVIVAIYTALTLLPVFTDAPFHTAASELAGMVLKGLRRPPRLPRILLPPALVSLADSFKGRSRSRSTVPSGHPSFIRRKFHDASRRLAYIIPALERIHKHSAPIVLPIRRAFLALLPRFEYREDSPLEELNWLSIADSTQTSEWRMKALFWLLQTPLSRGEAEAVILALDKIARSNNSPVFGPQFAKPLASCLSSVLADGHISRDEEMVTTHCIRLLVKTLDHAFLASESKEPIILKNDAVSKTLDQWFDEKAQMSVAKAPTPAEEAPTFVDGDEWENMVFPLWFCPTETRIEAVVRRLNAGVDRIDKNLLISTVHALHAAMLNWYKSRKEATEFHIPGILSRDRTVKFEKDITEFPIPDFLSWDSTVKSKKLDGETSAFLLDLFGALYEETYPRKKPASLPVLIIESLRILDGPENIPSDLLKALCSLIIIQRRFRPDSFDTFPSVADALLESLEVKSRPESVEVQSLPESVGAQSLKELVEVKLRLEPPSEDTLARLAYKFDAIAYGPATVFRRDSDPLLKIGSAFKRAADWWDGDLGGFTNFTERFLDAYTATMENLFTLDRYGRNVYRYTDENVERSTKLLLLDSKVFTLAQENPMYRLPFLYSLAMASTYATGYGKIADMLSWVGELFITTERDHAHVGIDRAMDTNFFAATLLRRVTTHWRLTKAEANVEKAKEGVKGKGKTIMGKVKAMGGTKAKGDVKAEGDVEAVEGAKAEKDAEAREDVEAKAEVEKKAKAALSWLQRYLFADADQIRWKGIYLLAELFGIIDDIQSIDAYCEIKQRLEAYGKEREAAGQPFVDPDWAQRRGELGLEDWMPSVSRLPTLDRGVYDWKHGVPLLFLYPQLSSLEPARPEDPEPDRPEDQEPDRPKDRTNLQSVIVGDPPDRTSKTPSGSTP